MTTSAPARLRSVLKHSPPLVAPGVFDGLSARLAELAEFRAVYASGGAIARAAGYPDIGLLSLSEVVDRTALIVRAVDLPVIADADTGFGNSTNVARAIELFERAGAAAIHIEDQQFPKRCGHLDEKSLVSTEEMCLKIRVAKASVSDADFIVIARTDAIAVEGLNSAIDRAKAYGKAGADMIFVEAPETVGQIEEIARQITNPKLINMFYGGRTPLVPLSRLAELGYQMVIIPSDLQRASIRAMQRVLQVIKTHGDSSSLADELASFDEREQIVRTKEFLEIEQKHGSDQRK
jgi:2-methylisocitrate lyase-like PEP mutase family enzyme